MCNLGLIHFAIGTYLLAHPELMKDSNAPPFGQALFGGAFAFIGGAVVLGGWVTGALLIYSARMMQKRKHRIFSTVMAALICLNAPLGTVLGVFTLIVLSRPSVKDLYDAAERP